jgi:small subunit ribosomal protein S24e
MSELKIEVSKREEVPLLSRERVVCWVHFEGPVPSRKELQEKICSQLKAPAENCVVKNVDTRFGHKKAKVVVHIYKSAEHAKVIEPQHLYDRTEGKKKGAAPTA